MSTRTHKAWVKILKTIDFPQACIDEECPHCRGTPDAYATGDSPTLYECEACCLSDCLFYEGVVNSDDCE